MSVTVIDASAIAAFLFQETSADRIETLIQNRELVGPSLLPFEVANACASKVRRFPDKSHVFLAALRTFLELRIPARDVDIGAVFDLAGRTGLTAYDASYLWLARELDAELVTLDAQLGRAYAALLRQTPSP